MTHSLFLRIKSLNVKTMRGVSSAKNVIKTAAAHNLRELVAEFGVRADSSINPARIALNYQLRGPDTAAGVADLAQALLDNAGVQKLRRDACMALELVFSLPQGSAVDHREYFAAAVAWADGFFNVPILSAAVHLDEPANHCHLLLLPLVAGRMQGGALAGGPAKIKMMLADFQQQVGQRFGLTHQPRAKRLSKANRDAAGRIMLDALRARPECLNVPAVRDALVAALGQHHETLLPLLDLTLPTPAKVKAKSFIDIMVAPCKPERTARVRTPIDVEQPKCIDVGPSSTVDDLAKFSNVFLCVDVAPLVPAFPSDFQRQQAATDTAKRAPISTTDLHHATNPAPAQRAKESTATAPTGMQAAPAKTNQHAISPPTPRGPSSPPASHEHDRDDLHRTEAPQRSDTARADHEAERQPDDDRDHHGDSYDRVSDSQPTEQWNADTGEWMPPERARASHKALAATSVRAALARIGNASRKPHIVASADDPQ